MKPRDIRISNPEVIIRRLEKHSIPEPNSGCLLWVGTADDEGYGRIRVDYALLSAHRVSYTLHCEEVSVEERVLHRCDTPACINPDHLFVGISAQNYADMVAKGRARHWVPRKHQRLTMRQAHAVFHDHRSTRVLAEEYQVSLKTVRNIKGGKAYIGCETA